MPNYQIQKYKIRTYQNTNIIIRVNQKNYQNTNRYTQLKVPRYRMKDACTKIPKYQTTTLLNSQTTKRHKKEKTKMHVLQK